MTTRTVKKGKTQYLRSEYLITCLNCGEDKWAVRKTAKYCSQRCSSVHLYANGFKASTEAAHDAIRRNGQPKHLGRPPAWVNAPNAELIKMKIRKAKLKSNWMKGRRGELHPNWKGGKHYTVWKSPEYQRWRKAVFERDNYTCVWCGDNKGGNLEADHIKPRYWYPELTFDINNGRTLCAPCHKKTDTYGNKVRRGIPIVTGSY